MSTREITKRIAEAPPRFKARLAGVFEVLEEVTSAFGQGTDLWTIPTTMLRLPHACVLCNGGHPASGDGQKRRGEL
jgi:hypothetical protein